MRAAIPPTGLIAGSEGFVAIDSPHYSSSRYVVTANGRDEEHHVEIEGSGYVPMFRSVARAIREGLLEDPVNPHSETIGVLETMDEVRRQLAAAQTDRAAT